MRMRRIMTLALLGAALPASAAAAPSWNAVETPEGSGAGFDPGVALDAAGDALLTWRADQAGFGFRQIRYAWRLRGGALSPAGQLSDYGATNRSVAVGWTGEAIAAWASDDQSIRVAVALGPGQPFGPAQVLGQPDDTSFFGTPKVVVDDDGNAVVGWMRFGKSSLLPHALMIATRTEGGAFGPPTELGAAGFGGLPDLAVNRSGLVAAAWTGPDGATRVALRQPGAAAFDPAVAVDLRGPGPRIVMGDDGTVVVSNRGGSAGLRPDPTQAVWRTPGGGFGPAVTVPTPPVVVDGDGTARALSVTTNGSTQPPATSIASSMAVLRNGVVQGSEPFDVVPDVPSYTVGTASGGRAVLAYTPVGDYGTVPRPIRFSEREPGQPFGPIQAPDGAPAGVELAAAVSPLPGSLAIAFSEQPTGANHSTPIHLIVRDDPAARPPARPTRSVASGPAGPAPASDAPTPPTAALRWTRGPLLRAAVTCPDGCSVSAVVRARGRTIGRIAPRRVRTGGARTLVLRPSARARAAIARERRRHHAVTAVTTITAAGQAPLVRRTRLR
jgi:hypothetical protein